MTSQKEVFLYDDHQSLIQELAFAGRPLADLIYEIQELYTSDSRPWIIGFSGGKDSTTVVSLVVSALQQLPIESLKKPVFFVSSDTSRNASRNRRDKRSLGIHQQMGKRQRHTNVSPFRIPKYRTDILGKPAWSRLSRS